MSLPATVSIISGSNNSDSFTLSGPLPGLNAAIATLVYTPPLNFDSDSTVTVSVNDLGFTGAGPAHTTTHTVNMDIQPVNDPPVAIDVQFDITKNLPIGTYVGTALASDPVEGDSVEFSTISGSDFNIAATGHVTVATAGLSPGIYVRTVTVTDSGLPIPENDSATVTIIVHDLYLKIVDVTFNDSNTSNNSFEIYRDPTGPTDIPYEGPQYKSDPVDPNNYISFPVAYKRNTNINVTTRLKTDDGFTGDLKLRAYGPDGIYIAETPATHDDAGTPFYDLLSISNKEAGWPLPNPVRYYEEFKLTWKVAYRPVGSWTWIEWLTIGQSENELYATYDEPTVDPLYHTLLHVSTVGAATAMAATDPPVVDEATVIDGVWSAFSDLDVRLVSNDQQLQYSHDVNSPTKTKGLLEDGNGQCMAWVRFFDDALEAQGLAGIDDAISITAEILVAGDISTALVIKNWNITGDPLLPGETAFPNYDYVEGVNIERVSGLNGQGVSQPEKVFDIHYVAELNGKYYDPSYGRIWASQNEWENEAFFGFGKMADYPQPADSDPNNDVWHIRQKPASATLFWTDWDVALIW